MARDNFAASLEAVLKHEGGWSDHPNDPGAGDRYYVYRPLLDLIGLTEGTDNGRGYNETLAYGRLTGGPR